NAWDLYDMHGSAAEWALDYYGAYAAGAATDPLGVVSGSARVLRGGGLTLGALETRSAARGSFDSGVRLSPFGFRLLYRIPSQ
ncbi:MAG: SUMF1/EgtB/PvdO family nonheme iron enzyme, partial [Candidatus Latescibacterota bacterium]|nr:SUMF1/EgtB/PvdO family nonheme iron enzyme [Candidatus Latescibacterota bacterium]